MKGKRLSQKKPIVKQNIKNQKNQINSYKINNEISPHLNVLQFDYNNNNKNNFNKNTKNVRHLSQKPIRKSNFNNNKNIQNIQNNNFYFNNINNNFIVKNSYPLENPNINNNKNIPKVNNNNFRKNSQKQLKPKNPSNRYNNNSNNNDKIKIKLDSKGVYIDQEEDVYEDPKDPVNKLNNVLKYRESNNLGISQEEKNMIETIKKVSSNRVQYRNTHQMLKEIGKIMKNPVVSFLIKKDPVLEKKEEPSDKLSEMLSQKLLEEQKEKMRIKKEEDKYYEELQKKIKEEIKTKGNFDFSKLPDKDRQMLAQRKVYNKIGIKVYQDYANNDNNDNNNINNDTNNINEKIDNQIKQEIKREKRKEEFLNEIGNYNNEDDNIDDYFNLGDINNNKKIKGYEDINNENNNENNINKEKPTARGILENILNKIEYKNEQLINHNKTNDIINNSKKENIRKKNF